MLLLGRAEHSHQMCWNKSQGLFLPNDKNGFFWSQSDWNLKWLSIINPLFTNIYLISTMGVDIYWLRLKYQGVYLLCLYLLVHIDRVQCAFGAPGIHWGSSWSVYISLKSDQCIQWYPWIIVGVFKYTWLETQDVRICFKSEP